MFDQREVEAQLYKFRDNPAMQEQIWESMKRTRLTFALANVLPMGLASRIAGIVPKWLLPAAKIM